MVELNRREISDLIFEKILFKMGDITIKYIELNAPE